MSIHREAMEEVGASVHLDTLGEAISYTVAAKETTYTVTASAQSEIQIDEMDEAGRERRRTLRRFTIDAGECGIAAPRHNDVIAFEGAEYLVDRIERSGNGTHTVLAWRKYSVEKTRVGHKGRA